MADYTPKFSGGAAPFPSVASAVIVGGTLVTASGNGTVAPSTAGDHSVGVAGQNAALGAGVTVWPLSNITHEVQIQDAITIPAGAPVIAGTTGFVATGTLAVTAAAGTMLGVCTKGGTGSNAAPVTAQFIGAS